ncbi:MAG: flagellar biosynthetic protein FliO [Bacillota bacterium]
MNYSWELVKIFIYLLFIIGIIILAARLFKKGYYHHNQGKYMKIIEQIYLGQKGFLSLVKIKDEVFLFSVTGDKIKQINKWPADKFDDLSQNQSDNFKTQLKQYIKGNWRDKDE